MAKKLAEYEELVKKALQAHGMYDQSLDAQVMSLASALRNLSMANDEISTLTKVTVTEISRYGEKVVEHPAFKVAKLAQEMVTRQMKTLHLTTEDLSGDVEEDPMVEVGEKLVRKRASPVILSPVAASSENATVAKKSYSKKAGTSKSKPSKKKPAVSKYKTPEDGE